MNAIAKASNISLESVANYLLVTGLATMVAQAEEKHDEAAQAEIGSSVRA
jgi:hypothetical protein